MNAIKEIYYGNISGYDIPLPKEWHALRKQLAAVDDKLEKDLTTKQREWLDKARELMAEMTAIERLETFSLAFKVGVGIGYESAKNLK
ncbi:MAG: hypothetical protein R3Y65_08520 [Bacillota bacterium]